MADWPMKEASGYRAKIDNEPANRLTKIKNRERNSSLGCEKICPVQHGDDLAANE